MEVGNVDSPIRMTEDELLNEPSDQEDSQAQEAGDAPRETSKEADPDTMPTGGETPSTRVTAGLSELSMSSPRAQPTPELESPTTSTPQGPASDTAPPEVEYRGVDWITPGCSEGDVKCLFPLGPPYWVYPTTQDKERTASRLTCLQRFEDGWDPLHLLLSIT